MAKPLTLCCSLAIALFALPTIAPAATITYPDLCNRLTDLDLLATPVQPGEKTSLASSGDRASQYDAVNDKYIHWDANGDDNGYLRKEGNSFVFADIQGPGCIDRMWSAKAMNGHVKLFLDGSDTPAVDLPFIQYFDGTTTPFNRSNLVYKTASGHDTGGSNNFTPIPFSKSCKIVGDPDWGRYYQITYTQFPPGSVLPTFHLDLSPTDSAALDHANQVLSECGKNPAPTRPNEKMEQLDIQAKPAATTSVLELTGAEAITGLNVKLDLPKDSEAARTLLRQLAIQMTWDDEKSPAVWSPLGDFFADLGGGAPFHSLPMGVSADGTFNSFWYMPFNSKAKIEIANDGPSPVAMHWQISHAPLPDPTAALNRFHAKWHRDAFEPTRADRLTDWTLLTTQGNGRYVGTQLHVWNPRGGWWGEGDDKFFVDGEKFPSSFGTGSEDYFGDAWGLHVFDRPFHGFVQLSPNLGHSVAHRWHIVDNVPFQSSFEGTIEKSSRNDKPTLYDCVAYWYLSPGGTDPYPVVPVANRTGLWTPPPIYHEPDAIEGEALVHLKEEPANSTRLHDAAGDNIIPNQVSGDRYLSWRASTVGSKLELQFNVKVDGNYQVVGCFLKRAIGGTYQMRVDGVETGPPLDLYEPYHSGPAATLTGQINLGTYQLSAGNHVLSIEFVGANSAAQSSGGAHDFDLDYIKLHGS